MSNTDWLASSGQHNKTLIVLAPKFKLVAYLPQMEASLCFLNKFVDVLNFAQVLRRQIYSRRRIADSLHLHIIRRGTVLLSPSPSWLMARQA